MKTAIRLGDELFAEVKLPAARTGRSLNAIIEDALRENLARRSLAAERPPVQFPTFAGKGLQPGVDPDDSAALLDLIADINGCMPPARISSITPPTGDGWRR